MPTIINAAVLFTIEFIFNNFEVGDTLNVICLLFYLYARKSL